MAWRVLVLSRLAGRTAEQGGRARNDNWTPCARCERPGCRLERCYAESTTDALQRPGDGERALSPSRREEHGAEDARGRRTGTASCAAAWVLYGRGESRAADCACGSRWSQDGFGEPGDNYGLMSSVKAAYRASWEWTARSGVGGARHRDTDFTFGDGLFVARGACCRDTSCWRTRRREPP